MTAQNNESYTLTLTYFEEDGRTPLYLTQDGNSGGVPLSLAMWLVRTPGAVPAAQFSTADYLAILVAPDDNVLVLEVPWEVMETIPAALYASDVVALNSLPSRQGYGSFLVPVEQGVTNPA